MNSVVRSCVCVWGGGSFIYLFLSSVLLELKGNGVSRHEDLQDSHPPFCVNQLRAVTAVAVFFLVFVLN